MCECDLDSPAIFEQVARKASKQHKCCECKRLIEPAETYIVTSGLWEGKWSHYKHCSECELLANKFMKETECCYSLGSLYSELCDSELINRGTWVKAEGNLEYYDSKRYFATCDWLEVVSQKPLKIVVKTEENIKAA